MADNGIERGGAGADGGRPQSGAGGHPGAALPAAESSGTGGDGGGPQTPTPIRGRCGDARAVERPDARVV